MEAELLGAVRRALPDDAIHCWDSTLLGYWAAAHFPTYGPRTFSYPVGSGTIGYSWPAAIGMKLAAEDAPVLAISGDGGILYGLVELGTAAQFGIPAKLLIVDDRSYGVLRHFQEQRFGRPSAVDLPATDFVAIAGGFGVPAKEVTTDDLESGLRWALDQPGPAVVVTQAELDPPPGMIFKGEWMPAAAAGESRKIGTAAQFTGAGITVNVAGDATTSMSARASDASNNDSDCSNAISYSEDSRAPAVYNRTLTASEVQSDMTTGL